MRDGKNKRSLAVLSGTVSSHVSRLEISTAVSWARRPVEQLASKTKNFRQQWALSRIQKLRARIRLFKRRRRYERGKEKTVHSGEEKKTKREKLKHTLRELLLVLFFPSRFRSCPLFVGYYYYYSVRIRVSARDFSKISSAPFASNANDREK